MNKKALKVNVVAVVITHSDRWKFLSQTIKAVLMDPHIIRLIIVDNGSQNNHEIIEGVAVYGERVRIVRHDKNLGSAGGFASGIAIAREENADFVYLSDDDMIPEDGFAEKYLAARSFFGNKEVIISGYRASVPGNSDVFITPTLRTFERNRTFFEVFSWAKIRNFIIILLNISISKERRAPFVPIVPIRGFVYGGAFIPIRAIREAPLPDASLFLYGDDVAYSWGIEKLGYACYASVSPIIHDIDLTFSSSHIYGIFEKNVALWKIYYRIRNMVRLSRQYSAQSKLVLFLSIIIWISGLFIIGIVKCGLTKHYLRRVRLIIEAVLGGYFSNRQVPDEVAIQLK